MKEWSQCRIGEVVSLQQGLCINSKSKHMLAEQGYALLRITDLINDSEVQYICPEKVASKFVTSQKDIIYTRTGQVGLVFKDRLGVLHNNCFKVIPNEKLEHDFLFWFLKSQYAIDYANAVATGAAQPDLGHSLFKSMYIKFPSKKNQRKIAAVLTAYDDLIETNKKRIEILEKMAEELYREWFVRMRFPGYKNTKFVKGVPEGWHFDLGSTFFDHVKGKSYSSNEISEESGACYFITLKSFHRRGGYRKEGLKYFSGSYKDEQCVEVGDVVMAVTDMTQDRAVVGEVARVPDLPGRKAVISLDVIRLIPKDMSSTFLYSYMRYSGFGNYIKEFANGANVLHLKPDLVGKQKMLFPPNFLREQFSSAVDPIYKEINALENANTILKTTRDLLLPRLISGKLSVEDLDIQFPPSMREEEEPELAHA